MWSEGIGACGTPERMQSANQAEWCWVWWLVDWFSLTLTPAEVPWLFRGPDQESSWASTSAELLGSLVAPKVFDIGKNFQHLAASHIVKCGGGTDNKAASSVTSKRLSTKLPLLIILMEYLGTCEEIGLRCHLDWRPRDTNTEADDLTNGRFEAFQDSRRIQVSWSDLDLPYIQSLMKHSETFSKRRLSGPLQHLSEGKFQKSKWGWNNLLRWGYACVVSASRFALLRAFVLISAWSQSLNFTWHPSNLRQKGSPHFSMLFALVCCDSCCRFQWCSHFHFPYRVGTPRALINMASLDFD